MINGNPLANSSVVVKKECIDTVGGLNEDKSLVAAEDYDLWLRISMKTEEFKYIPEVLGGYWVGGSNLSGMSDYQIGWMGAIIDRYASYLNEKDRKQMEAFISYDRGVFYYRQRLWEKSLKMFKISLKSERVDIKLKSIFYTVLIWASFMKTFF